MIVTLMDTTGTIAVLNRVLAILRRSFPQYLRYARPYVPPNRRDALERIHDITAAQEGLAARLMEVIVASGAVVDSGEFPMEFTDTHDLAIDYLLREAMEYQRQDIAELESLLNSSNLAPPAQSLVAEALGMAKGHLETLKELKPQPDASTIVRNGEPAYDND